MIASAELLIMLHNTPIPDRSRRAVELGCTRPDAETHQLFANAGLIALGLIPTKNRVMVFYQSETGQLGQTEL